MPKVLYSDNDYPDIDLERAVFAAAGLEVVVAQCKSDDQVIAAAKGCRAILVQYAPISATVLAALPELGVVSRIGAGYDTVDTGACVREGVWLANSPDYGVGEVSTHALAMALAMVRNVVAFDRDIKAGEWNFLSSGPLTRPASMTLGIVGLGRIGKRMAHISRNVFKRVIGFDPHNNERDFPDYIERVTALGELAAQADVISLHTPLTPETRGMIDARFFARVRRGTYFVNTARGAVVDLPALVVALESGLLAGAALDVLPEEPVPRDSPLLTHPRVILSPHAAFYSVEAAQEMRRKAAQNIVSWFTSGRPDYVVTQGTRLP